MNNYSGYEKSHIISKVKEAVDNDIYISAFELGNNLIVVKRYRDTPLWERRGSRGTLYCEVIDFTTFTGIPFLFEVKPDDGPKSRKSRQGHLYVGFAYAPTSMKAEADAFNKWKIKKDNCYPRMCDCIRFAAGIFTDCGLSMEDFTEGRVLYDDLFDYVKAFNKNTTVGKPFKITRTTYTDPLHQMSSPTKVKEEMKEFIGLDEAAPDIWDCLD